LLGCCGQRLMVGYYGFGGVCWEVAEGVVLWCLYGTFVSAVQLELWACVLLFCHIPPCRERLTGSVCKIGSRRQSGVLHVENASLKSPLSHISYSSL
jgi:hypothetical protein